MERPIIFPEPRHLTVSDGTVRLRRNGVPGAVAVPAGAPARVQQAAQEAAALWGGAVHDRPEDAVVVLRPAPDHHPVFGRPGGYALEPDGERLQLWYADEAGARYGVQTLRWLVSQYGCERVPVVTVHDWPALPHRGIYIESIWGADRMGLDDFKQVIDLMSSLKMNLLVFGLYGCWERKHDYEPAEFLFVKLKSAPDLVTPQSIRYLDPDAREWRVERYVPVIAEQDLAGDVFRYAVEKGIEVIPVFNGPAHNTYIPRVRLEISAVGRDGRPTTYGYCVSNPATYEFLGACYREIYERYLKPHGITSFDIGCDEVYPIMNVLPDDPRRVVDPTCFCPRCRSMSPGEQLLTYIERAGQRLVELGIDRILIYGDSLARMGLLNEAFVERFKRNGLFDKLVLGMWAYREPLLPLHTELGLRVFAMPSTGYGQILFYQDFTDNIYRNVQHALRSGAHGVFSYSLWDPAQHRNVTFLADAAWNGAVTVPEFTVRYAQRCFGRDWRAAVEAQVLLERVLGSYPLMIGILDHLIAYFNLYPYGHVNYPADVLSVVADDPLSLRAAIRNAADQVEQARRLLNGLSFFPGPDGIDWSTQVQLQCERFVATMNGVLAVVDALFEYMRAKDEQDAARGETARVQANEGPAEQAQTAACSPGYGPERIVARLRAARERLAAAASGYLAMMKRLKERRPHFVVPAELREQSGLAAAMLRLEGEFDAALAAAEAGEPVPASRLAEEVGMVNKRELWHPWLF